jgi:phage terminase small subunit
MPVLENPKWEKFAQAVALGMNATEAYRQHVSRGKCANTTAEVEGCKMSKSPKIAQRILELREKVAAKVESKFAMTKDKWLDELAAIAAEARQTGDFSAASGALAHIGKASAYFEPERHKLEIEVIIGGNAESQNQD